MAERNSIDLIQGSQDLSSSFYHYHRQHGGLWYIKNSAGQFLDCSDDFLCVFCSMDVSDRDTFIQKQPDELFGFFYEKLKRYEKSVQETKKKKILIVSLLSRDKQAPYICTLLPCLSGVYTKIDSLYFMGTERKIINAVCSVNTDVIDESLQPQRFENVNPFLELDPDDWLIAWLMSARISQREIASFMGVNIKAVERRVATIYTSLVVENHENFMILSDYYQWNKFIPPRFSVAPVLNELRLI